jgi:PAS domain S-box-containing protein
VKDLDLLKLLNPFHIVFNSKGEIQSCGKAMQDCAGSSRRLDGESLLEIVTFEQPKLPTVSDVLLFLNQSVRAKLVSLPLRLVGQVIELSDNIYALVSTPWLTKTKIEDPEIEEFKPDLTLAAPHETWADHFIVSCILANQQKELQDLVRRVAKRKSQLESSGNRLTAIINTVVDGICTLDPDGFVYSFNARAQMMFGRSEDDAIGQNFQDYLPEESKQLFVKYLKNCSSSMPRSASIELKAFSNSNALFPLEIRLGEMHLEGSLFYTAVLRDVSERNRNDDLKNQFIAAVSHELRTPLTTISGALNLVLGGQVGSLNDTGLRFLKTARSHCDRLELIVNDILNMEKIRSGKMNFELKKVSVFRFLTMAVHDHLSLALPKNLKLILSDNSNNCFIWVDEMRLMQVFSNLVSNAVKFTREQSSVEVTSEILENRVRIDVRDFGPGISAEFEKLVFERFSQDRNAQKNHTSGTGLGLNISKGLVESMGGTLSFKNAPEGGVHFYFEFPIFKEAPLVPLESQDGPPVS